MATYSTREVAVKLGMNRVTLQRYIARNLIPVPPLKNIGGGTFREWRESDIERVRKRLLKIKNGRKKKVKK